MAPIDFSKLPQHVAIIMDGNGRWARARGLDRVEGHRRGVNVSEDIIDEAKEIGVRYLTLYAFSQENWDRPQIEVETLMKLLKSFLIGKKQKMLDHGIRFNVIGRVSFLPQDIQEIIKDLKVETAGGQSMMLTLALSYGAQDEIIRAVAKVVDESLLCGKLVDNLNQEKFSTYLDTAAMPDPDLIIRTSGEYRISNFLLWQGAYAEYYFEKCYWPDFTKESFRKAILEYQRRERRFGKVVASC